MAKPLRIPDFLTDGFKGAANDFQQVGFKSIQLQARGGAFVMTRISEVIKLRQFSKGNRRQHNSSTQRSQSPSDNRGLKAKPFNHGPKVSTVNNRKLKKGHFRVKDKQLELGTSQKPAISAKLAPNSHHHSKCDRYWICCNHVDKQFGGLYYRAEIDYILKHFAGRTGLIEPREFDPVAERAVAISTGRAA